jgi:ABC-type multidrug transport system permease subunit
MDNNNSNNDNSNNDNSNNNNSNNNNNYNQQPQYNQPYYNQQPYNPQYQPNSGNQELEPPISLGSWLLIMLLVAIPCVNIIMLFIWAFSRDVITTKKNYSRAMLIFMAISIVLGLIFGSLISTMIYSLSNLYYY